MKTTVADEIRLLQNLVNALEAKIVVERRLESIRAEMRQVSEESTIHLELNDYQRRNLLHLLNACGYPHGNPYARPELAPANTGDWLGEVVQKLALRDEGMFVGPTSGCVPRWPS